MCTEWGRISVRLIHPTKGHVRTWTVYCNKMNSINIDDVNEDKYNSIMIIGVVMIRNKMVIQTGMRMRIRMMIMVMGMMMFLIDDDNDDDDVVDDDDVHVVYLLTRLTGVPWIWWTTFAGACVVVQGSTIVAHSATTVCNNIIFKLTPWIQNSPTLVNKLWKVHIWKIEN